MNVQIEESWKAHLEPEFEKDYFRTLTDFVKSEYSQYQIFPPGKLIFNAFNLCPFDKVKVVIIGQDPYHGPGQAHGLCFSVNDGVPFPPSLVNIFKEIKADIGTDAPATGNLTRWAEQGVLLLNATLTKLVHTRTVAGKHLLMLQSMPWQKKKKTWYLSCGDHTLKRKERLSTATNTWYSLPPIPLLFLLTTASSETNISAVQTTT